MSTQASTATRLAAALLFALLFALAFAALCSGAALSAQVGARHQAEGMTDLGSPAWAVIAGDETGDDGTHMRFKEIADGSDRLRFTTTIAQSVDEIRFRARLSPAGAGDDRLAVWVDGEKRGSVLPPAQQTMTTQTLSLATPIAAGSHTVEVGPNQLNDAFVAFDWLELSNTGVVPAPPDQDGDGVADADDNCDLEMGPASNGGCPEPPPAEVVPPPAEVVPPPAEVVPPPAEVVPPPAEVVGNQDGDAFDDYVDLCPGTASGGNLDGDNDKIGNGCDSAPSTPATDTGADQMRVKTNGCKVNAVNRVDPIAYTQHLHRQFGNRSTTNESTGAQLKANASTSCDAESGWFTSAAWFPVEGNAAGTYQEDVLGISTYYRAPGNQAEVKPIPTGLQLLATEEKYNCTASGVGTFKETPPYGCYGAWTTKVIFPDCWNMASMEEDTMVYSGRRGVCPSTHPYRISQVSFLIRHANNDNFIPNPLMVSSGVDEWSAFTNMHADYFAALQDEFGRDTAAGGNLVDLCLRNANDGQDVAHPRCGEGP